MGIICIEIDSIPWIVQVMITNVILTTVDNGQLKKREEIKQQAVLLGMISNFLHGELSNIEPHLIIDMLKLIWLDHHNL